MWGRWIGGTAARAGAAAMAVALAASAGGCWLQPRYDPGRSGAVPFEDALTPGTVGDLTELWSTEITLPGVADGTTTLAPVVVGDRVYALTADELGAALDLADGEPVWLRDLDVTGEGGPAVAVDDPVYAGGLLVHPFDFLARQGGTQSLDPATGARADWSFGTRAFRNLGVIGDDVVSMQYSIVTSSLAGVVVARPGLEAVVTGPPNAVRPTDWALVGDSIALGNADELVGFLPDCPRSPGSPSSCSQSWATELGAQAGNPTAVGAEQVAIANAAGTVSVIEMATGTVLWRAELGTTVSQPTVARGSLLVATGDGRLVAYDAGGCGAPTCPPLWTAPLPTGGPGQVVAAGEVAYVGTGAGTVVAFDLAGCATPPCAPLATVDAGSPITGGPVVGGGRVVVGTASGTVVAFGLPGMTRTGVAHPPPGG